MSSLQAITFAFCLFSSHPSVHPDLSICPTPALQDLRRKMDKRKWHKPTSPADVFCILFCLFSSDFCTEVHHCHFTCSFRRSDLNVASGSGPQAEEKFWRELDEVIRGIPRGKRKAIGADFDEHVGEGKRLNGKFAVQDRDVQGHIVVDGDRCSEIIFFQKTVEHRAT